MKFRRIGSDSPWVEYRGEGLFVQAKVFDSPSRFGIDDGRISKLWVVRNGNVVISYDRGWDIQPKAPEDVELLNKILGKFPVKEER